MLTAISHIPPGYDMRSSAGATNPVEHNDPQPLNG